MKIKRKKISEDYEEIIIADDKCNVLVNNLTKTLSIENITKETAHKIIKHLSVNREYKDFVYEYDEIEERLNIFPAPIMRKAGLDTLTYPSECWKWRFIDGTKYCSVCPFVVECMRKNDTEKMWQWLNLEITDNKKVKENVFELLQNDIFKYFENVDIKFTVYIIEYESS